MFRNRLQLLRGFAPEQPSTQMRVLPSDPFSPSSTIFSLRRPAPGVSNSTNERYPRLICRQEELWAELWPAAAAGPPSCRVAGHQKTSTAMTSLHHQPVSPSCCYDSCPRLSAESPPPTASRSAAVCSLHRAIEDIRLRPLSGRFMVRGVATGWTRPPHFFPDGVSGIEPLWSVAY